MARRSALAAIISCWRVSPPSCWRLIAALRSASSANLWSPSVANRSARDSIDSTVAAPDASASASVSHSRRRSSRGRRRSVPAMPTSLSISCSCPSSSASSAALISRSPRRSWLSRRSAASSSALSASKVPRCRRAARAVDSS